MNEIYIVALMTGLVGSLHCIGMCGPIAIALPLGNKSWFNRSFGSLIYNIGRTITYGVLGALFGLLGQGIEMAGLQRWATILIGVIMILSVLFPVIFHEKIKIDSIFSGYAGRLIGHFRKLFSKNSIPSLFFIGLLNGLLPCGLVYVAIAGAISTGDIFNGILYMILFGLGTIPVMFAIPLAGNLLGTSIRKRFQGVVSAFIVILGILFILRGLALGIPYISPPAKMLKPHEKQMMHKNENVKAADSLTLHH
jgi:uncharacterized protein